MAVGVDTSEVVAGIGVFIMFLIVVIFYKPPSLTKMEYSREELRAIYGQWEMYSLFVILVSLFVLGGIWYLLILHFVPWYIDNLGPSVYVITTPYDFWMVPALFLGIISSPLPLILVLRYNLRERYKDFTRYRDSGRGRITQKILEVSYVVICGMIILLTIFAIDDYTRFTEDEIVIDYFWGLEELRYSYSEVQTIRFDVKHSKTPSGEIRKKPYFVIEFKDGNTWTTWEYGLGEKDPEVETKIIKFVSERSGKSVQQTELNTEDT